MSQVKMYVTTWCPYCEQAKRLLRSLDVSWSETNIEEEGLSRAELAQLTGGFTVPQIVINGKSVGGFDDLYALNQSGRLGALLEH
ncbi:MAG: glutaredoxin domain-containing protein [Candidatus Neomarinimicrobiota bacterium]